MNNLKVKATMRILLLCCFALILCGVSCQKSGKEQTDSQRVVSSGDVSSEAEIIPVDVSLSDVSMELGYGITRKLDAVGGNEIQWSTSDAHIASVDSEGNVKGIDLGECVITAVNEYGRRAQCRVTVKKTCYLSFDDGPASCVYSILNALKENDAKATFFLVDTAFFPAVNRIQDEGHALGLHTKRYHAYKNQFDFFVKLDSLNDHLEELTGIRSNLLRFPGGSNNRLTDALTMRRIINGAHDLGYRVFDWSVSSDDADKKCTYALACQNVRKHCWGKQEIVLFHHKKFTPRVIRTMIPELRNRGYVFETLDHYPDDSYEFRPTYSWTNPDLPAEAIEMDHSELELEKGSEYRLSAILTPSDSTDFIVWMSSDESVVKVNKSGEITGVEVGEVVITARTTSGVTSRCRVTVTPE